MNDDLTPLPPGTRGPDFWLLRTHYEAISLTDVRGHPAVVVFYPGDWEPLSRQQLTLYQQHLPQLVHFGAALIAISLDSIWSHVAFRRTLDLTFPLLSDFHPKGAVSRAYGVYREVAGQTERAVFIVDAMGIVRWSRVYPTSLNPGVDGMLTALETMQAKEATE